MSESPVDPQGPQFGIQRIYVKDVSFEVPRAPEVFTKPWQPKMKMDINSRAKKVEEHTYEVVLTLSLEARDDEDQVGFICELSQAGIFFVEGVEGPQLQHTLSAYCPSLLFPYARACVDGLVTRGSFPALMLAHVNQALDARPGSFLAISSCHRCRTRRSSQSPSGENTADTAVLPLQ